MTAQNARLIQAADTKNTVFQVPDDASVVAHGRLSVTASIPPAIRVPNVRPRSDGGERLALSALACASDQPISVAIAGVSG